jgi:methoxymalonate biosynthesis acyl carrier protein
VFSFSPTRAYLPAAVNTLERLRTYVTSRFAPEGSTPVGTEDDLLRQGILDSIAIMEIAGFIEETFGFPVEGDEITVDNFQSLAAITRLVERKLGASRE